MTLIVRYLPRPWWWLPRSRWWSTIRAPWQRMVTVYHPRGVDPCEPLYRHIRAHEDVHVEQWGAWWGPWIIPLAYLLLPLPFFLSGRWWIERRAYLRDIRSGRLTVEQAVATLWTSYLWPWPRWAMRRYFDQHHWRP